MNIKFFKDINKSDVKEVGGKGASLGELTQAGIPVPPGFVVTTDVYKKFHDQAISPELEEELLAAFDQIGATRVAVRSSAVAEDSSAASWAGQLETYLNTTRENLIERIQDCWSSISSERATVYAKQQGVSGDDLAVAVVVQKMVNSESSGVMFSVNPISKNQNEVMIESSFGLGEMIVQGEVIPDNFIIDKEELKIKNKEIHSKEEMLIYKDRKNQVIKVSEGQKELPSISNDQVIALAKLAKIIEAHYGKPQDIEWALEKGELYIVQSRAITTLS